MSAALPVAATTPAAARAPRDVHVHSPEQRRTARSRFIVG